MQLSAKMVRERLAHMKPRLTNCSLETSRKGQNAVGAIDKLNDYIAEKIKF